MMILAILLSLLGPATAYGANLFEGFKQECPGVKTTSFSDPLSNRAIHVAFKKSAQAKDNKYIISECGNGRKSNANEATGECHTIAQGNEAELCALENKKSQEVKGIRVLVGLGKAFATGGTNKLLQSAVTKGIAETGALERILKKNKNIMAAIEASGGINLAQCPRLSLLKKSIAQKGKASNADLTKMYKDFELISSLAFNASELIPYLGLLKGVDKTLKAFDRRSGPLKISLNTVSEAVESTKKAFGRPKSRYSFFSYEIQADESRNEKPEGSFGYQYAIVMRQTQKQAKSFCEVLSAISAAKAGPAGNESAGGIN